MGGASGLSGAPAVSVIVPSRNRGDLLGALLASLVVQTADDFEVVVIDDGSSPDLRRVVEDSRSKGLDVSYVRTDGVGAVAARRRGIEEARGDVFAFTDSDCVAEPGWIAAGLDAVRAGADVVQGVTVPKHDVGLLERSVSYRGGEGLFATCNVFYGRSAFEKAGGFEPEAERMLGFRPDRHAKHLGFGEDTLLGWRVARAGSFAVAQDAVIRHEVLRPPLHELFSRAWQTGAFPSLVREVPELRRTLLKKRLFLGHPHRLGLYAAAAATLVGAVPVTVAGLLVWGALRSRASPRGGRGIERAYGLAVELAIDAATAAALVVGSVRTRTVVL